MTPKITNKATKAKPITTQNVGMFRDPTAASLHTSAGVGPSSAAESDVTISQVTKEMGRFGTKIYPFRLFRLLERRLTSTQKKPPNKLELEDRTKKSRQYAYNCSLPLRVSTDAHVSLPLFLISFYNRAANGILTDNGQHGTAAAAVLGLLCFDVTRVEPRVLLQGPELDLSDQDAFLVQVETGQLAFPVLPVYLPVRSFAREVQRAGELGLVALIDLGLVDGAFGVGCRETTA